MCCSGWVTPEPRFEVLDHTHLPCCFLRLAQSTKGTNIIFGRGENDGRWFLCQDTYTGTRSHKRRVPSSKGRFDNFLSPDDGSFS